MATSAILQMVRNKRDELERNKGSAKYQQPARHIFTPKITEIIEGRIKRKSFWRLLTIRFFNDEDKSFCNTLLRHLLFHLHFAYKSMPHLEISFDFLNVFCHFRVSTPFCIETTKDGHFF